MDTRTYQDSAEYLRAYYRNYYKKNKDNIRARQKKKAQVNVAAFKEWKATLHCTRCSESDPSCLDFHHLDPNQKDKEVGSLRQKSLARIKKEAEGCIVLCANCHRKEHANIAQW